MLNTLEEEELFNEFMEKIDKSGQETNKYKQMEMFLSLKTDLANIYNNGYKAGHADGVLNRAVKNN